MTLNHPEIIEKLKKGNEQYLSLRTACGDVSPEMRRKTAAEGQLPYAVVITCSDSRVIPEAVFSAGIGELFVIRVAGNVIDSHQLGSIEYAVSHLHAQVVLVLGHTHCGAVGAAMHGNAEGFIRSITDEIRAAIGGETDDLQASFMNARHSAERIRAAFDGHPEIHPEKVDILSAVYDIETGRVRWDAGNALEYAAEKTAPDAPPELTDREIYDTPIGPVCMSKTEYEEYLERKNADR